MLSEKLGFNIDYSSRVCKGSSLRCEIAHKSKKCVYSFQFDFLAIIRFEFGSSQNFVILPKPIEIYAGISSHGSSDLEEISMSNFRASA